MIKMLNVAIVSFGFILGSILFSKLIPEKRLKIDITKGSNDENPGAFNAFAKCGIKIGIICVLCDLLKGIIPVLLYIIMVKDKSLFWLTLVTLSPVLGHTLGIFNEFKGGKGITTLFGVFIGLMPISYIPLLVLICYYLLFSLVVQIHPNRIKSMITCVLSIITISFIFIYITKTPSLCFVSLFPLLLVFLKHTKYFAKVPTNEKIAFGKVS